MPEVAEGGGAYEEGGNIFTRQIGPLPGWVWLVVIVGGVLLYKIIKGGGSSSSSGDTGNALGFGGYQSGGSTDANQLMSLESLQAAIDALTSQNANLANQIANDAKNMNILQSIEAVQQKLAAAMNTRESVLFYMNKDLTDINTYKDALAKCRTTTCRNTYNAKIKASQTDYSKYSKQLSSLNTVIADLQKQLSTLQSTLQIAPPSTTSTNMPSGTTLTPTTSVSQPTMTVA